MFWARCPKKGIQRVDLSFDACPDDIELRELLTLPSAASSSVMLLALLSLDILASRADDILGPAPPTSLASSTLPRPTDLCSSGCPDDTRSILLLETPGRHPDHRVLRPYRQLHAALTSLCSFGCPDKTGSHRLPGLLGPRHPRCP
ncbi:hypothetical protein S40285_10915 [Stachybotrys chlorohalonatus IBT 40285]|uniref:Uncharacterized protein n=1 Tax=Stachybotrys chlorohalonatus (strain IBT 40285) TaxID=1283841 RepID=A0A084Q887_STAC4|nr:hypothetical protein S40285_10915 [Stachybotrys chlorohalonata IBT 40285]